MVACGLLLWTATGAEAQTCPAGWLAVGIDPVVACAAPEGTACAGGSCCPEGSEFYRFDYELGRWVCMLDDAVTPPAPAATRTRSPQWWDGALSGGVPATATPGYHNPSCPPGGLLPADAGYDPYWSAVCSHCIEAPPAMAWGGTAVPAIEPVAVFPTVIIPTAGPTSTPVSTATATPTATVFVTPTGTLTATPGPTNTPSPGARWVSLDFTEDDYGAYGVWAGTTYVSGSGFRSDYTNEYGDHRQKMQVRIPLTSPGLNCTGNYTIAQARFYFDVVGTSRYFQLSTNIAGWSSTASLAVGSPYLWDHPDKAAQNGGYVNFELGQIQAGVAGTWYLRRVDFYLSTAPWCPTPTPTASPAPTITPTPGPTATLTPVPPFISSSSRWIGGNYDCSVPVYADVETPAVDFSAVLDLEGRACYTIIPPISGVVADITQTEFGGLEVCINPVDFVLNIAGVNVDLAFWVGVGLVAYAFQWVMKH